MNTVDKWDRRFLDLAKYISGWSKDPSTKVGAVITQPSNKRIVSTGFNGFPAGVEDSAERLTNREIKYEMVVHAELNALLFAGSSAHGGTLYVYPLAPCARCAVTIIQAGIKRIVAPKPDFTNDRWGQTLKVAEQLFLEAGLDVDYIDP
jgi:dCMP deaminase